ncbi:MAG: hypothetical protein H2049_05860 [Porphyrobacter sp.]|nr:hypothetical protein [Porphyrobacter sp.]
MTYVSANRRPNAVALAGALGIPGAVGALLVVGLAVTVTTVPTRPNPKATPIAEILLPPPPPPTPTPRQPKDDTRTTTTNTTVPHPNPPPQLPVDLGKGEPVNTFPIDRDPITTGPIEFGIGPSPSPASLYDPVGAKPKGNPGKWVTNDDYRPRWVAEELSGTARFTLQIDARGARKLLGNPARAVIVIGDPLAGIALRLGADRIVERGGAGRGADPELDRPGGDRIAVNGEGVHRFAFAKIDRQLRRRIRMRDGRVGGGRPGVILRLARRRGRRRGRGQQDFRDRGRLGVRPGGDGGHRHRKADDQQGADGPRNAERSGERDGVGTAIGRHISHAGAPLSISVGAVAGAPFASLALRPRSPRKVL